MLLYYVRHGDPIYNPNALTELGKRQAEALSKRLALYGLDKIYSSTSTRAIQTAEPTSFLTKKEIIQLDWCNEKYAWDEFTVIKEDGRDWLFKSDRCLMASKEIAALGHQWWWHPAYVEYDFESGYKRIWKHTQSFLEELGYKFNENTGVYDVVKSNDDRIALFAHQGFGIAFLSCVLNIPYPVMCKYDLSHSGVTVIEFREDNGVAIPQVLTLSNDSHLYHAGLPTKYQNRLFF